MSHDRKHTEGNLHIKDWPEGDRPREMLLEKGAGALSDAAVLAILLRTGRQGQNAIALGRDMINKFGGLNGLMTATCIENPRHLFEYLKASMSNLSREEFRVLHLNRSKHLIAEEVLFRGTVDESSVYNGIALGRKVRRVREPPDSRHRRVRHAAPTYAYQLAPLLRRAGPHADRLHCCAGGAKRLLDSRTWDEMPVLAGMEGVILTCAKPHIKVTLARAHSWIRQPVTTWSG